MNTIKLTLNADEAVTFRGMLLKMRASELSDLRRIDTQLVVYGERRANLSGEPAMIIGRMDVATELLRQIVEQS